MKVTIDFESRSACDLKKHGAWVYSEDPTTEVLCMSFKWEGHKAQCLRDILHHGGSEEARALVGNLIKDASTIEAHNMAFEYAMWTNVCAKRYGWPPLPVEKLRCSAAKAAMHSLPRHLEGACQALGLKVQKDMDGHRLMLKMCKPRKPRKPRKDEPEIDPNDPRGYYWHEDPADFERLYDYCIRDVESEEGLSDALRDLPAQELAVWQLDQKINARGIRADIGGCNAMIAMTKAHEALLLKRLAKLTNGAVRTAKQIEQLKGYLRGLGVDLPDLAAATVKEALKGELNATAREILEIRSSLGRSSASKYQAILDRASTDGRVRGTLLYHGAGTGRWCLTGDAEILTKKGWSRIDQWDDNDPIACWSKEGRVDFCGAQLHSFDCREDLVKVSSRFLDGVFTPDHRVPSWSSRGNFHVSRASDFADRRVTVPTSGILSSSHKTIPDTITRLIVMTQADGFVCTNPRHGRMVRFHFKKPRKIRRAIALLEAAKVRHTVREYGCGTTIKIRMEDAPQEMREAKEFGPWVMGCAPGVFIDELRHWDGCVDPRNATGGFEYSTKVKANAEWAATMAHLAGVSASIAERVRAEEKWAPSWRVHIRNQDRTRVLPRSASRTPFVGKVFCPETPTGFFMVRYNGKIHITGNSGAGIQPQNFPSRIKISAAPEEMLETVCAGGIDLFGALYEDDPMSAAGAITRSVLMAEEGKDLVVADYSAIEGRVLAWLAGEETELDAYRKDLDPYIVSASVILHKPYGEITKDERNRIGKTSVLACGYGGSVGAVRKFGGEGMTDDEIKEQIVKPWREAHPMTVKFWYELEEACMAAVANPSRVTSARSIQFRVSGSFLMMRLPSGRLVYYYDPQILPCETSWGEIKNCVTYMTVHSITKKWVRTNTYSGKLAENATQAVARDLMALAMLRVEEAGYPVVLSVHDELISEVPEGFGSVAEFEQIMCELPPWAMDLPLKAAGWRGRRYRK